MGTRAAGSARNPGANVPLAVLCPSIVAAGDAGSAARRDENQWRASEEQQMRGGGGRAPCRRPPRPPGPPPTRLSTPRAPLARAGQPQLPRSSCPGWGAARPGAAGGRGAAGARRARLPGSPRRHYHYYLNRSPHRAPEPRESRAPALSRTRPRVTSEATSHRLVSGRGLSGGDARCAAVAGASPSTAQGRALRSDHYEASKYSGEQPLSPQLPGLSSFAEEGCARWVSAHDGCQYP